MKRLRQLLLRLYPAEWRARYGEELAALVEDVTPSWSSNFDLLKGALKMQFSIPAFPTLALMLSMAGLLTGLLVSFAVPAQYTSASTLVCMDLSGDRGASVSPYANVLLTRNEVLSRGVLSSVIQDPRVDLYGRDREKLPIEDVIDEMRRNTSLEILSSADRATTFRISFTYPEAQKAQRTVNAFITKLFQINASQQRAGRLTIRPTTREQELLQAIERLESRIAFLEKRAGVAVSPRTTASAAEAPVSPVGAVPRGITLEVVDPPSQPTHPVWPDRNRFMTVGFGGGFFLALGIVAFRPRRGAAPPTPASSGV